MKRKRLLAGAVAVFLGLAAAFLLLRPDPYKTGRDFLQSQENRDLKTIEAAISKNKLDRLEQGLKDGTMSVYALFNNAVILGDSRAQGFGELGLVPMAQVLAERGDDVTAVSNHLEEVKAMQPEYIYLSYGINDMGRGIGADRGENGYRQVFEEQVSQLKEAAPDAKIVVNSIIHAGPAAVANSAAWAAIEDYNAQLKQMCKDNGWIHVDNDAIDEGGNGNFYQSDQVHFATWFYDVWAGHMADAVLEARK